MDCWFGDCGSSTAAPPTGINSDLACWPIDSFPPSCFLTAGSNALIDSRRVSDGRSDGLDGETDTVPVDGSSSPFVAVFEMVLMPDWRARVRRVVTALFKMSMSAITIHQNGLRERRPGRHATLLRREADDLSIQARVGRTEARRLEQEMCHTGKD